MEYTVAEPPFDDVYFLARENEAFRRNSIRAVFIDECSCQMLSFSYLILQLPAYTSLSITVVYSVGKRTFE